MIKFLIHGLLRDRHRSLFPVITVTIGVTITVLVHCWVTGVMNDFVDFNARYDTGHVKIMTRAYAEDRDQMPNDLALLGINSLMDSLKTVYPKMDWVARIRFGGLLDAPDENGETRAQGPAVGFAIDMLSGSEDEIKRFGIRDGLIRGTLPQHAGEILISDKFAERLKINPGDEVTLLTASMYGGMVMQNFTVSGTVSFGVQALDRGAMIADLHDIQTALEMNDGAGEILGYSRDNIYHRKRMRIMAGAFNAEQNPSDEFAPVMLPLAGQNDLQGMLDYMQSMITIMISVFVLAMCVVLWNAGLIGGLRRYGEIGVRLAIGEEKRHIYMSMILESCVIGLAGSILGTALGLALSWVLQTRGITVGGLMENATMMMPNTFRAQITAPAWFIGFVPGLFATILGTVLSGIGIYRRQTASLFKELQA